MHAGQAATDQGAEAPTHRSAFAATRAAPADQPRHGVAAPERSSPDSIVEVKPGVGDAPGLGGATGAAIATRLVWAVVPCFNRPDDLRLLLEDMGRLDGVAGNDAPAGAGDDQRQAANPPVRLRLTVVDNASAQPLDSLPVPAGLDIEFLRLPTNTGGAGGYNAGMAWAIREGRRRADPADFVWLVDSDVRLEPASLQGLVAALDARQDAAAVGSAVASLQDDSIFEVGGRIERLYGQFGPRYGEGNLPKKRIVECTYTAACSALVRREAIEATGLFPDVFLNGDDVEWFIRMRQRTGMKILATTDSIIRHPTFGRYTTMPRYYMARNAFGPIDALGLGGRVRLFRALREVPRAVAQCMVGREDLASLHIKGLRHALERRTGAAPAGTIEFERPRSFASLAETLAPLLAALPGGAAAQRVYMHKRVVLEAGKAREVEKQLAAAGLDAPRVQRGVTPQDTEHMLKGVWGGLWRMLVAGPGAGVSVIHARGRPASWARGRVQVLVSPEGFVVRRLDRRAALGSSLRTLVGGVGLSIGLAFRKRLPRGRDPLPRVADVEATLPGSAG
ncbi:MAG: glycosyltransferase [Phycisphaerales bacterium]